MRKQGSQGFDGVLGTLIDKAAEEGFRKTLLLSTAASLLFFLVVHQFVLVGWSQSSDEFRATVEAKEAEIRAVEKTVGNEAAFKARFDKMSALGDRAQALIPKESEIADVLKQVQVVAQRNQVELSGLQAVRRSFESPLSGGLYEREVPAVVKGEYPNVYRFLRELSRMPRLLLVTDYAVTAATEEDGGGGRVVAFLTIRAFHTVERASGGNKEDKKN